VLPRKLPHAAHLGPSLALLVDLAVCVGLGRVADPAKALEDVVRVEDARQRRHELLEVGLVRLVVVVEAEQAPERRAREGVEVEHAAFEEREEEVGQGRGRLGGVGGDVGPGRDEARRREEEEDAEEEGEDGLGETEAPKGREGRVGDEGEGEELLR